MNTKLNSQNIEELISTFGKREAPDELMMKNAQAKVKAHWQASVKQQKTRRRRLSMMRIAASFVALAAVLLLLKGNFLHSNPTNIGEVLFTQGTVSVSTNQLDWHPLGTQTALQTGQWLKTTDKSYINFALSDQSQIRLNANTVLHLDSTKQIHLLKGEIYHDADTQKSNPLLIKTQFGVIEHIGTRYAVSVNDKELVIKVRNGLVKLSADTVQTTLNKGDLVELNPHGKYKKSYINAYDAQWNWTKKALKPFVLNHKNLADFINNYAHENGLEINWNKQELIAKQVELVGDFAQLRDAQLLKTVFLSTKFDFEIKQGILTINP